MAFQILCQTLRQAGSHAVPRNSEPSQAGYNDIEAIRLWKCGDGDKDCLAMSYMWLDAHSNSM